MKNSVLNNKNFRLLGFGTLVSLIGTEMQNFALSLYVLKVTGSATQFASVLAITLLPQLILGPFGGVLADWLDRKKLIVLLDLCSGLLIGGAALIYLRTGMLTMPQIYAISIILSMISLVFQPASGTIIPTIVEREDLVNANGVISVIQTVGNIVAPIIAGILMGFFGLFIILLVNAISFIGSAISEMFIELPRLKKADEKKSLQLFLRDFKEGIHFLFTNKLILSITLICMALNLTFNPLFSIGIPYILKQTMMISDSQFGIFNSILIGSMLTAPILSSRLSKRMPFGKLSFITFITISVLILIYALVPAYYDLGGFKTVILPFALITAIGFLIAMLVGVGNIAIMTIMQKEIPIEIMGRVKSASGALTMSMIPLGQMIYGIVFDIYPGWIGVLSCGVFMLFTVLAFKPMLLGKGIEESPKPVSV